MKSFNQLISEIMTSTDGSVAGMHLGRPADSLPQIAGREAGRLAIRPRRNRGKKKIQKDHVEYDEVYSMVQEYFEEYFGETLNESTSDEDIMEAVYDLIELTEAVVEAVALPSEKQGKPIPMDLLYPKDHPRAGEIIGGKKKASPKQHGTNRYRGYKAARTKKQIKKNYVRIFP